jgi:hypothetical protein
MRVLPGLIVASCLLSACSLPFTQSSNDKKSECDRIAAQAIQTKSLEDAKTLSARASACYAQLQGS